MNQSKASVDKRAGLGYLHKPQHFTRTEDNMEIRPFTLLKQAIAGRITNPDLREAMDDVLETLDADLASHGYGVGEVDISENLSAKCDALETALNDADASEGDEGEVEIQ